MFPRLGNLLRPICLAGTSAEFAFDSLGGLLDIGITRFQDEDSANGSRVPAKYFFRGECACFPYPTPGIFREETLKHEKEIFHFARNNAPTLFSRCRTKFDMLCEMAHYGFPTRLLDVSPDLAMAWFMAVDGWHADDLLENLNKPNGLFYVPNILVFRVPAKREKFVDSDLVSILSNVALMNDRFESEALEHEVRSDRPAFDKTYFDYKGDCSKNWLVYPRLDNPRVKRQKGAFILHGLLEENCRLLKNGGEANKLRKDPRTGFAFPEIRCDASQNSDEIVRCARLFPSARYFRDVSDAVAKGASSYRDVKRIKDAAEAFRSRVFRALAFVGGGEMEAYDDDFVRKATRCKQLFSK